MILEIEKIDGTTQTDGLRELRERAERLGMRTFRVSSDRHVIACSGEVDPREALRLLRSTPGIAGLEITDTPHPLAYRVGADHQTIVRVSDTVSIGGDELAVIAGPCSVEGREMLLETALAVRERGANLLRGGAFKPRTSPYSFRGLGDEALEMLAETRAATSLPIVTEVMDPRLVERVAGVANVLQVGARNMQNYPLLAELGRVQRPVLLKRSPCGTLRELLLAAEHIMSGGNTNVVLCERGIRTFETATRSTLDLSAVPVLRRETHLPVVVDPSHAAGANDLVEPLALAAIAAGADGFMVEVHPRPREALSDGAQSLDLAQFGHLMRRVTLLAEALRWAATDPDTDISPAKGVA